MKRRMRQHSYIFVLWGEQFDEVLAVLAITTLRAAGQRVKVVGLHGPCAKGAHGLGLLADLTLDQALPLVAQASGVVIPCTMSDLARAERDPRVGMLLTGVGLTQVMVGVQENYDWSTLASPPLKEPQSTGGLPNPLTNLAP